MPGAATLFYGEEIGMGENLDIDGRLSVRTPMQWDDGPSAGFSTAPADALCRPMPADDEYGPKAVNVRSQRSDPDSLLNWFERLIRLRKEAPEIGWGECTVLDADDPALLVMRFDWKDRTLITAHNLSPDPAGTALDLGIGEPVDGKGDDETATKRPTSDGDDRADGGIKLHDLMDFEAEIPIESSQVDLQLEGYGHRWLRLIR
jgi:glycosidase